jgi:hypothetical protein
MVSSISFRNVRNSASTVSTGSDFSRKIGSGNFITRNFGMLMQISEGRPPVNSRAAPAAAKCNRRDNFRVS